MNKSTETIHSRAAHTHTDTHTHRHTHIHSHTAWCPRTQETRVALPSFRSHRVPKSAWADWRLGGSPTPAITPPFAPPPPLANPNSPTPLGNAFRVCFIEHFIALTYGTIKIDLSHSKHKSVAKPKAKQSYNVSLKLLVYSFLSLISFSPALWSPLYLYLKVSGPLKRVMDEPAKWKMFSYSRHCAAIHFVGNTYSNCILNSIRVLIHHLCWWVCSALTVEICFHLFIVRTTALFSSFYIYIDTIDSILFILLQKLFIDLLQQKNRKKWYKLHKCCQRTNMSKDKGSSRELEWYVYF